MKSRTLPTHLICPASLRLGIVSSLLLLIVPGSALFGAAIPAARLPAGGWKPGIPGGIPANYTLFVNLKTGVLGTGGTYSGKRAAGDGTTDDTAAINAALNACPNGQFVYLPTGDYSITGIGRQGVNNFDNVDHSFSIVLRGDGRGKTNLKWRNTISSGDGISFSSNSYNNYVVTAAYAVGATTLTLNSTARLTVGRWIILFADNSMAFDPATAVTIPGYMVNTFAQMAKVTAISGNTITLDRPMRWTLGTSTQVWQSSSVPVRCGLENFTIENVSGAGLNNLHIIGGQECWVRNVESKNAYKWHFRFSGAAGCEARQCIASGFAAGGGGGDSVYGFGLFSRTGETLIEDNVAYHCRHAYITEYGGQGNVFGYNYSCEPINENQLNTDYLMGDMIQHGGLPMWNLWEGNVAATIKFDYVLGGSRYLTAYRNQVQRKGLPSTTVANFQYDIQRQSYYVNLVGNVFEAPPATYVSAPTRLGSTQDDESNPDANVVATLYRHGNYDVPSGAASWDAGNSDHLLPNSLYLPNAGASAPAFWDGGAWPSIGPDTVAKTGGNPAFRRWQDTGSRPAPGPSPTPGPPPAPQNLRLSPPAPAAATTSGR